MIAYPRTESEISDFSEWTTIKAPFVPSLELDDVEMGGAPDPATYDVIRVPASSESGSLEVVAETGAVPLADRFDSPTTDDGADVEGGVTTGVSRSGSARGRPHYRYRQFNIQESGPHERHVIGR